jgi:hypothetical protein
VDHEWGELDELRRRERLARRLAHDDFGRGSPFVFPKGSL